MILIEEGSHSHWLLQQLNFVNHMGSFIHLQLPLISRTSFTVHIKLLVFVRKIVQEVRHDVLVFTIIFKVAQRSQLREGVDTCHVVGPSVDPGGLLSTSDFVFLVLNLVKHIPYLFHIFLLPNNI